MKLLFCYVWVIRKQLLSLCKFGVYVSGQRSLSIIRGTELEKEILDLHNQGISGNQISKRLGIPMATVYRKLRLLGMPTLKKQMRRDPALSQMVVDAYETGLSGPEIAKKYGCSPSTISRLLKARGITARPLSPYQIDEDFFSLIDREDKAYTLGFFTADGCLTRTGVMMIRVTDLDIIQKIKDAMGHTAPYRIIPGKERCKPLYTLEVARKQIADDLIRLGCGPAKTFTTTMPAIRQDLYRHYIRGLTDGDGSISRTMFRISGTASLLGSVLQVLREQLNVGGGIYANERIFVLNLTGAPQVRRVLNWLYQDATIYMKRKYDTYRQCVEEK